MEAAAYFKGKKITLMGLGLLGRGVGDAKYLAECGADLIVTDLKTEELLAPSLQKLKEYNITYTLGEHTLEDFTDRDLVLKAPKTPLDSPYIQEAKQHGIPVTMSTALAASLAKKEGATVIGVTGTRGKTTTTMLIAHLLKEAGKHVVLGGNIRDVSTLARLPEITKDTYLVLELDSWQLQGFREEGLSPDVAVFTTFYRDHMDYYEGDEDAYLKDKAEIFVHQDKDDVLVLGSQIAPRVLEAYPNLKNTPIVATAQSIESWEMQLLGAHNRDNAACAVAAVEALGVERNVIQEGLRSFKGVEGRLELIAEKRGVKFYNDTTSTTPEAAYAALTALNDKEHVILICGGYDKGLDMSLLLNAIPLYTKKVVLLDGSGTKRIQEELKEASVHSSLAAAVSEAIEGASQGDVVLFSPAFASFGMFKNEYDRGDQFVALINNLP